MNITALIRKTILIFALIWAMFMIIFLLIHFFDGTLAWDIFFASLVIITIPFLIAHIVPNNPIVSLLREIHELNEEQYIEREGKEVYLFDGSKITYYPKKLFRFLRGDFLHFLRGDF